MHFLQGFIMRNSEEDFHNKIPENFNVSFISSFCLNLVIKYMYNIYSLKGIYFFTSFTIRFKNVFTKCFIIVTCCTPLDVFDLIFTKGFH